MRHLRPGAWAPWEAFFLVCPYVALILNPAAWRTYYSLIALSPSSGPTFGV